MSQTRSQHTTISAAVAAKLLLTLAVLVLLSGCLHRRRPPPGLPPVPSVQPPPVPAPAPPIVQGEEGIASWYGNPFNGRSTASGETFNMYAMTAAHRTLPFGTRVRVHDLENGQSVVVRINDRGPFVRGRIIDLSYAAAQALGMPGTALVRLEILNPGEAEAQPGIFAVQVGAFTVRQNAERLKAVIQSRYQPVIIQGFNRGNGYFYRVRVGSANSEAEAEELARELRASGFASETFVVRLN